MNNKFRFIALALIILMIVSLVSGFVFSGIAGYAQSVESMQKELDELAKKKENKGKVIVALLPDTGERYLSTEMFAN